MRRITAYYAHSKYIYNTLREDKERSFLESKYSKIVCPYRDMSDYDSMTPYLERVKACDVVVCSELLNYIGKGVYQEIEIALKMKKPVLCLRTHRDNFILKDIVGLKINDETDWKFNYGKVKTRLWG